VSRNEVTKQPPRSISSKLIVLLLLLGNLLPDGVLSAETGPGGTEDAGKAATQNLSIHASRVLYEAQQLLDRKEYDKAARILKEFIEKHAKEDHCLVEFTLGNALYFCGQKEESLARYEVAVELDPAYGPVWVNLGQVAYDLKQYRLAAEALAKGFSHAEEADKNPDLLYYAAVAHIMDGHPEKAAPILEDLVSGKHGETDQEWFRALLDVYLELDREKHAERLLHQMIQQYGDESETWRLLYQFEASRKNYKMAAVALKICSYLKPLTREEEILLADLYAAIKVPVLACEQYERAFASGASPEEYERLASAYMAAHEAEEARKTLVEALEKKPTASLWSLVGDLNYLNEDFEGAYYAFEESARLDPKDGRAYLMMGYCALQAKKKEQAADALRKAQGFPKQTKLAKQLLKSMD
jgi:tetratricopeptide (TPR) repeat protein